MEDNDAPRPLQEEQSVMILFHHKKKRLTDSRPDRKMLFAPVICLPLDVRTVSFLRVRMPEYT
jgi:hypothetical protein